jgi:hypothetical protein
METKREQKRTNLINFLSLLSFPNQKVITSIFKTSKNKNNDYEKTSKRILSLPGTKKSLPGRHPRGI